MPSHLYHSKPFLSHTTYLHEGMDQQMKEITKCYPQEPCKDDEGTTEDLEVGCWCEIESNVPVRFIFISCFGLKYMPSVN